MDTKLYGINDMVKVNCNGCKGCSDCCRGMGESIILDPYDIWQLENHLNCTFAELMQEKIELHVTDGLILPNLKMQGDKEHCVFLNAEGRCGIHALRPGLCRLFPLGRNYDDHEVQYFILEDACKNLNFAKIKVKKWLEIPDIKKYSDFLVTWHDLRKDLQKKILSHEMADVKAESNADRIISDLDSKDIMKEINMKLLHIFYEKKYTPEDFYGQFEERMALFLQ